MLLLQPLAVGLLVLASPPAAAQEDGGFANPELLVDTAWLAGNHGAEGVAVVDVRGADDYAAGHVPGALHLSVAATYAPDARGELASRERIAAELGARGITPDTRVVLYDEGRSVGAAWVFWALEVRGHDRVSVLDGGFAKWTAEGRPTSTEPAVAEPVDYAPGEGRAAGRSTVDEVLEAVEAPDAVLVDARSSREWDAGRIPAAVRIEWVANYTDDDVPVLRSPAELRALYRDQGVTQDKRVHAY